MWIITSFGQIKYIVYLRHHGVTIASSFHLKAHTHNATVDYMIVFPRSNALDRDWPRGDWRKRSRTESRTFFEVESVTVRTARLCESGIQNPWSRLRARRPFCTAELRRHLKALDVSATLNFQLRCRPCVKHSHAQIGLYFYLLVVSHWAIFAWEVGIYSLNLKMYVYDREVRSLIGTDDVLCG